MREIDPTILEQLRASVQRCGIALCEFEISYEDYLQSEEIRVSSAELSDEKIECLHRLQASPPFPIVTFVNPEVLARACELQEVEGRKRSRAWHEHRDMLSSLPTFDPAREKPLEFAHRLEAFCGIKPGTAFEFHEELSILTPKIGWIDQPLRRGWLWRKLHGKRHNDQFECLLNAMSASNAEERNIKFGFLGNEAYSDGEPQE